MKRVFLILCIALFSMGAFAQGKGDIAVGGNLSYGFNSETFAIGAKAQYYITDQIRAEANADYWLKKEGFTWYDAIANLHYLIGITDKVKVYPLAGVGYLGYSSSARDFHEGNVTIKVGSSSGGDVFFNTGGGAQYSLTDKITISAELKYMSKDSGQFWVSTGVAFKL